MNTVVDKIFSWAAKNKLGVKVNNEVHMVNDHTFFKTDFIINKKTYLKISSNDDMTTTAIYNNFAKSFGNLIVLPEDIIDDLNNISREDIEKKFNIKF